MKLLGSEVTPSVSLKGLFTGAEFTRHLETDGTGRDRGEFETAGIFSGVPSGNCYIAIENLAHWELIYPKHGDFR